jgi:hypothetical protein
MYYRTIHKIYHQGHLESEFWVFTMNAHLLEATTMWCQVFGSDGCNKTHWKNLFKNKEQTLFDTFRAKIDLLFSGGYQAYAQYWEEMIFFRNEFVAHRSLPFKGVVPDFSLAIETAYIYDEWVREVIAPDVFEEPPLKQSVEKLLSSIQPMIQILIGKTCEMNNT